jgi:hypothetical protein
MPCLYEIISAAYKGTPDFEEIGHTFVSAVASLPVENHPGRLHDPTEQASRVKKKKFIEGIRGYVVRYGFSNADTPEIHLVNRGLEEKVHELLTRRSGLAIIGEAVYEGSRQYLAEMEKNNQGSSHSLFLEYNRISTHLNSRGSNVL